jgi:hypothetical protein
MLTLPPLPQNVTGVPLTPTCRHGMVTWGNYRMTRSTALRGPNHVLPLEPCPKRCCTGKTSFLPVSLPAGTASSQHARELSCPSPGLAICHCRTFAYDFFNRHSPELEFTVNPVPSIKIQFLIVTESHFPFSPPPPSSRKWKLMSTGHTGPAARITTHEPRGTAFPASLTG